MNEEEMQLVKRILVRLEPFMQKHLMKLLDDYSSDVYLSVITNLATSLMANGVTMVNLKGGDVQQYVDVVMSEVAGKHQTKLVAIEAHALILKAKGSSTCQPRH